MLPGLVLCLALACAGPAIADDSPFVTLESTYEELRARHHVPGLAAAVFENGRIIWFQGFGFADRENQVVPALNTPYRLASVSKPLAAALVMREAERGTLKLDDPLDAVPGVEERFRGKGILLSHLLSHTSHDLGNTFQYSGAAYDQLTRALEHATGRTYASLVQDRLIDALDLKDCSPNQYAEEYAAVNSRLARPYRWIEGKGFIPDAYIRHEGSAAAGLIMSVADLAKVDIALDNGLLCSRSALVRMWTPTVSADGAILPYGLGWFTQKYQNQWLAWHYGWWDCSSALWLKIPNRGLTLVLLANGDGLSSHFPLGQGDVTISDFARAFLEIVFPLEN